MDRWVGGFTQPNCFGCVSPSCSPLSVSLRPIPRVSSQVTLKLENYLSLGEGFKGTAREYGIVKQQLAEAKSMLAKFDDLRHELGDTWAEDT